MQTTQGASLSASTYCQTQANSKQLNNDFTCYSSCICIRRFTGVRCFVPFNFSSFAILWLCLACVSFVTQVKTQRLLCQSKQRRAFLSTARSFCRSIILMCYSCFLLVGLNALTWRCSSYSHLRLLHLHRYKYVLWYP